MHIIPTGLAPDNRALAERLIANAADPAETAAIGLLLGMHQQPILRADIAATHISDDEDGYTGVEWTGLGRQLGMGIVPVTPAEAEMMTAAVWLAGLVPGRLDQEHRALLVEAVAHACGVPLMPADFRSESGDGTETSQDTAYAQVGILAGLAALARAVRQDTAGREDGAR